MISSCGVEGNINKESLVEQNGDTRCIQAGELAITSTAPGSRWLLVARLCCPSSPTSVKCLEVYWFISAGREVGIVLIVALGLHF